MSSQGLRQRLNLLWESSWLFPEYLEKYLIRQALIQAKPFAQGCLLDIGCGHKPYAGLFVNQISAHLGIDYPLTVAQHMSGSYLMPDVDVYGTGEALPLKRNSIDTVLCTQVMEHSPEPDRAMAEMARVLRPGGYLLLTVPQEWGLHQEPHDYYRYTRYGLDYLAHKHGLEIEYIEARGGFWAMMGQRWSAYWYDHYLRPLRRRGIRWAFLLLALLLLPLCALTQLLALGLDTVQPIPENTLGYIMVAGKPLDVDENP
jgi:SAM-dependent methyltransferase